MKWLSNLFSKNDKKINEITDIYEKQEIIENKEIVNEEKQLTQSEIERIINKLAEKDINTENYSIDLSLLDSLFEDSARIIVKHQSGSTSLIQRKFEIGYNRAGRIMDQLELAGIVGPIKGASPRDVYIQDEYRLEQKLIELKGDSYILPIFSKKHLEFVETNYCEEIKKKREELEHEIELKKSEALELEKQTIREELLEDERKKQLRRLVKKELIEGGHLQRVAKRIPIPQDIQDRVWVRDGGKCVICGSSENLEFDHIIPFSKGGANTYRNIQLLCEKCNREKSNKIG